MLRLLFCLLLFAAVESRSEIYYFRADSVSAPDASVAAIEARAVSSDGEWRLIWPGVSIQLKPTSSYFVDGVDEPRVKITCGNQSATSGHFDITGYNTIAVEWNSGDCSARILGGDSQLYPIMTIDSLPRPAGVIRVENAKHVEEIIIETNPNAFERLTTAYTDKELEAAPQWRYLDRESDPKVALLGGNYTLALVGDDLVYVSGAKTNASHWHKGMLKGKLTPTAYQGYYRLQWYDATGRQLADESYAQFNYKDSTMTLTFPSLQASLRFTSLLQRSVAVGGE